MLERPQVQRHPVRMHAHLAVVKRHRMVALKQPAQPAFTAQLDAVRCVRHRIVQAPLFDRAAGLFEVDAGLRGQRCIGEQRHQLDLEHPTRAVGPAHPAGSPAAVGTGSERADCAAATPAW